MYGCCLLAAVQASHISAGSSGMQVLNRGGVEALILDAAAHAVNTAYGQRVAAHEAGHFLVAYLLGLLPKRVVLSSLDAFQRSAPTPLPTSPHLRVAQCTMDVAGDFILVSCWRGALLKRVVLSSLHAYWRVVVL